MEGEDALTLLNGVADLYVAKGKKTLHFDLANDRPSDDELLSVMLGRSGKLRAPSIRAGKRFLVGYNSDILPDHLT